MLHSELGTDADYFAFTDGMRARQLAHLLDFVPNHVGIGTGENAWFSDVLENGASSLYADFFDIDWDPPTHGLAGKVLLPVLGGPFGQEINERRIGITREGGRIQVTYYERRFPASPTSYLQALSRVLESTSLPALDARAQELESILGTLRHLPVPSTTDPRERSVRARERDVIHRRLSRLCSEDAEVARLVDAALQAISNNPEWLATFVDAQNYRLSYWKVAMEEINYRRFFDVNELAAIRMEDPQVFEAAHGFLLDLVRDGRVTALRLDHTDGLFDPEAYLRSLQAAAREALRDGGHPTTDPMYIIAEKILEHGEEIPRDWALSGSTGYDFLAIVNGLWIDPSSERSVTRFYSEFTGNRRTTPRLSTRRSAT